MKQSTDSKSARFSANPTRRQFLQSSCVAGLSAGLFANWGCSSSLDRENLPNIILISLDTTRADHMSSFGYARNTSPNLDVLAKESVFYRNGISTSSWTLPAHASMFTGKFVTSHGARKYASGEFALDEAFGGAGEWDVYRVETIREDEILLADHLRDAGYKTGAVVAGPWLKKNFGLHRGFDYHDDDNILGLEHIGKRLGIEVTQRASAWVERIVPDPFFLFLNYFDPHPPLVVPNQFLQRYAESPDPGMHPIDNKIYDVAIYFTDWVIGHLVTKLKALNAYDNTMIIVTADHGTLFGEHGREGHGAHLYTGQIHVPFFVKYPNGEIAPGLREEYVQPVDILPIIFERLGMTVPQSVQGGLPAAATHPIISEVYPPEHEVGTGQWQALYENEYKFLLNDKGDNQLYDIRADRLETNNLIDVKPVVAAAMRKKLTESIAALPAPEGAPSTILMDDQTREELESMGYLN